jgi:hypothetical protein
MILEILKLQTRKFDEKEFFNSLEQQITLKFDPISFEDRHDSISSRW